MGGAELFTNNSQLDFTNYGTGSVLVKMPRTAQEISWEDRPHALIWGQCLLITHHEHLQPELSQKLQEPLSGTLEQHSPTMCGEPLGRMLEKNPETPYDILERTQPTVK